MADVAIKHITEYQYTQLMSMMRFLQSSGVGEIYLESYLDSMVRKYILRCPKTNKALTEKICNEFNKHFYLVQAE